MGGASRRGGSSRPRTSGSAVVGRELAAARAAQARQDKAAEAQRLQQSLQAIEQIHHAEFTTAQRPIAPPPPAPDLAGFLRYHQSKAKAEVSVFARTARKAALQEAARRAHLDAEQQSAELERQRVQWQTELDAEWGQLCSNHAEVVLERVAEAFEDNEAAAAPLGLDRTDLTVVVVVPPLSAMPDRRPTRTDAGTCR